LRYLDEYRDPDAARRLVDAIRDTVTRDWTLMEVCGGQTHAIVRFGIDELLPDEIELLHGPGCPVCVTPTERIDRAIELAGRPEVILCSFGDMLRVPGTATDLLTARSEGADVRTIYSPLDALGIATENPDRQVVFFGVGFETTAPAIAMAVKEAARRELDNFSVLVSHVLVPPALDAILSSPDNRVQGFLAAGHVCTVMGTSEYPPIAEKWEVPIVVTGFEPLDILQGVYLCVKQLEEGRHEVENQYSRSVREEGNRPAMTVVSEVFSVVDREWRGIGNIPRSGLGLALAYATYDADQKFGSEMGRGAPELGRGAPFPRGSGGSAPRPADQCIAGEVLRGVKKPADCPAFGTACTPDHPLGAPMVSSEGACAAYFRYRD
jgi:hydrogenase expression/formation protein HypD